MARGTTEKAMLLADRVALITGSSRGIGAEIARSFALEGAKVAVHGRDASARASVADGIRQKGGTALEVGGDVTSYDDVEAMTASVEQALGPVDILVVNAGGSFAPPGPIEATSEQDWRRSLDGNLTSAFFSIKSVLPGMKARGRGVILTITSAAARRPYPVAPIPYAVAKAGLITLTQDIAAEAGRYGVRANCIAPETILTERNKMRIPAAVQQQLIEMHPIRRLGTPQDVAEAAVFLASDRAAWITGVVLDIAGGSVLV